LEARLKHAFGRTDGKTYSLCNAPSLDALCHFACIEHDTHRSETRIINYSYNEAQELIEKRDSKYGSTIFVY